MFKLISVIIVNTESIHNFHFRKILLKQFPKTSKLTVHFFFFCCQLDVLVTHTTPFFFLYFSFYFGCILSSTTKLLNVHYLFNLDINNCTYCKQMYTHCKCNLFTFQFLYKDIKMIIIRIWGRLYLKISVGVGWKMRHLSGWWYIKKTKEQKKNVHITL